MTDEQTQLWLDIYATRYLIQSRRNLIIREMQNADEYNADLERGNNKLLSVLNYLEIERRKLDGSTPKESTLTFI